MIRRNITDRLAEAMADRPVVLLHGPRQTGKSTLARWLVEQRETGHYLTLDDATSLAAARQDPRGFVGGLSAGSTLSLNGVGDAAPTPLVIDEVQRVPELLPAIKLEVDHDRRPGGFLLTGSANALLVPRISESLAGRMEIVTLWPLSQGEIAGVREGFIDAMFRSKFPTKLRPESKPTPLAERIVRGGYPEAFDFPPHRRTAWFESYVTTVLQRDVRDLANIEGLTMLPRLLAMLAARVGSTANLSDFARGVGIPQSTLKRYFTLLETTFLIRMLPPWFTNTAKRLVKSPKLYLTDTGLASHLVGFDARRMTRDPQSAGHLLENFVVMELTKQATWSDTRVQLYHFRTAAQQEVDLVLENPAGDIVGVEIKTAASVSGNDLKGLRALAEIAGSRFVRGVVLYGGREIIPFSTRILAVPFGALWGLAPS